MIRIDVAVRCTLLLGLALLASGCARSPAVSYYALGSTAGAALSAANSNNAAQFAVEVPELPAAVDRDEIVEYLSTSEVLVHEYHRWASELDEIVQDALIGSLRRHAGGEFIVYKRAPSDRAANLLSTEISRFELRTAGAVLLEASWMVADWHGNILIGPFNLTVERALAGQGTAAAVAEMSAALDELAAAIAVRLRADARYAGNTAHPGPVLPRTGSEHD